MERLAVEVVLRASLIALTAALVLRMLKRIYPAVLLCSLLLCSSAFGQNPAAQPEFEVASVRPAKPVQAGGGGRGGNGKGFWGWREDPGMLVATNITLKELFRQAYRLQQYQLTGGASWLGEETYDVSAKSATPSAPDELRLMLRKLLADRFRLKFHIDTKQTEVMALVVAKSGPKFHLATEAQAANGETSAANVAFGMGPMFRKVSFETLAHMLSGVCGTLELPFGPIIDMTGNEGDYDLRVQTRANPDSGPRTLIDQFCEAAPQLGLELKREKVPIDLYVIDSADKVPTDN